MKFDDALAKRLFLGCGVAALLLLGAALGALHGPTRALFAKAGGVVPDLRRNGLAYAGVKPTGHIEPLRADVFQSVEIDHSLSARGATLLTGLFGDKLGARLVDRDGAILHEWPVDFFSLFPEDRKYRFGALVHGDHLYPNGDLLVVVDSVGMARISACGDIRWKTRHSPHHSIDVDDDGMIWAPLGARRYDDGRLGGARIDRIAKFDPETGERLLLIDISEVLTRAGQEGIVMGNTPSTDDLLHINDVEILDRSMAAAFPALASGDIMVSARNVSQIWILDGKTHEIKWWRTGPMHGQHDPDFQPNGEITVFDNQTGEPASEKNAFKGGGGGSRIIAINPSNHAYRELYGSDERNTFYSAFRGKHQVLENGGILITESEAGRAFEAAPDGRIAWAYVNRYDDNEVGWLMSATRYPESYADIGKDCPAQ